MNKDSLKKLATDKRFIADIHVFCDRWCERCAYTSRCMNFAINQSAFRESKADASTQQAVWTQLQNLLKASRDLLKEVADREGISMPSLNELQAPAAMPVKPKPAEAAHALVLAARTYHRQARQWFLTSRDLFKAKTREFRWRSGSGEAEFAMARDVSQWDDAMVVIRWYMPQIEIKLTRAVDIAPETAALTFNGHRDVEGHAKVALIGMDRSLTAWGFLMQEFPDTEDEILPILSSLSKLQKDVETAFPFARAFKRPGFDS